MTKLEFYQDETYGGIKFVCTDADTGLPIDISGTTPAFHMSDVSKTTNKVNSGCTITDGPNGICQYNWQAGDLDTPEHYLGELEIPDLSTKNFKKQDLHIIVIQKLPTV